MNRNRIVTKMTVHLTINWNKQQSLQLTGWPESLCFCLCFYHDMAKYKGSENSIKLTNALLRSQLY